MLTSEQKVINRRAAKAKYRYQNPEKLQQYILDNYEWYLWNSAKSRARRFNMEFTITKEDIVIPENCPYLGTPITRIQGSGRHNTNPSVDRIDNSKGYVPGNIQVISDLANRMKNSATDEQLKTFARAILGIK